MAVLTSFAYARDRQRSPITAQRVRYAAISNATVGSVFNRAHPDGMFARVSDRDGALHVAWSPRPVPGYDHENPVDALTGARDPRIEWDVYARLRLLYTMDGTVYERASDDAGITWNTPTALFTGGRGDVVRTPDGLMLYAARVGTALHIRRQYPGDTAPVAAIAAVDDAAAPLSIADESFQIAASDDGRIWWHGKITAATATSLWYSTDDGASFTLSDGAVTGFASAARGRITVGADGTLHATADVGGDLHYSRRSPGDTAWSATAAVADAAAAAIPCVAVGYAAAGSHDGHGRVILSVVCAGDALPCDFWSADQGATYTLF